MSTSQEIMLQVAIAQRNEAMNAALNAATEAHLQRERANALQKEIETLKAEIEALKKSTGVPQNAV